MLGIDALMPLRYAARKYKVPATWLEKEARAGRLPCLIADGVILFDEQKLIDAMKKMVKENKHGN